MWCNPSFKANVVTEERQFYKSQSAEVCSILYMCDMCVKLYLPACECMNNTVVY